MRSQRGWVQSPSGLREKSIGHLGKVHRAFGKSPSGILGSFRGHFGEVQGPGGKARWTFQKTRWTFISWGCGGGFSYNGGANHVLGCHRFGSWFGSVRVGVASTVHVWAYCEDCSYHRKHHTYVRCIIVHSSFHNAFHTILSNVLYSSHGIVFDILSVSLLGFVWVSLRGWLSWWLLDELPSSSGSILCDRLVSFLYLLDTISLPLRDRIVFAFASLRGKANKYNPSR